MSRDYKLPSSIPTPPNIDPANLLTPDERKDFIKAARYYMGTKWVHLGRADWVTSKGGVDHGVDCLGLLICAAKRAGLIPPEFDIVDYVPQVDYKRLFAEMHQYLSPIPFQCSDRGDVLLYAAQGIIPVHLGMLDIDDRGRKIVIQASLRALRVSDSVLREGDIRQLFGTFTYEKGKI